jgi:hypothetical protein
MSHYFGHGAGGSGFDHSRETSNPLQFSRRYASIVCDFAIGYLHLWVITASDGQTARSELEPYLTSTMGRQYGVVELSLELLSVLREGAEEADPSSLFCVSLNGSASGGYEFVGTEVKSVNPTPQEGKCESAGAGGQLGRLFVCLNPLSSSQSQLMFVKAVDDATAIQSFKAGGCQAPLLVVKVGQPLITLLSDELEKHTYLTHLYFKGAQT